MPKSKTLNLVRGDKIMLEYTRFSSDWNEMYKDELGTWKKFRQCGTTATVMGEFVSCTGSATSSRPTFIMMTNQFDGGRMYLSLDLSCITKISILKQKKRTDKDKCISIGTMNAPFAEINKITRET